ncbi:peptide MFS transporter [Legionella sp. W05-934-2]|uniref:peptide MFS transporter n=1 Tax=Legionella sp. W05-934-2 TaxID=1198649 RepID=UPI0034629E2D
MSEKMQKMPSGVAPLYYIQAFSTFSFAILYSSLALFLTQQLGYSQTASNSIVGLFLAFNFVLHLFGGMIGGSLLSNRNLYFITSIMQCVGMLLLAISPQTTLFIGLSLFLVGCGLNTTCYNTMLTQRFKADDNRRETAFFSSYSWMNAGFLAGYFLSGFYDFTNDYSQLFYIGVIVNALVLFVMLRHWPDLGDIDTTLQSIKEKSKKMSRESVGLLTVLFMTPIIILCFKSAHISNGLVVAVSVAMFFVILGLGFRQDSKEDKEKIFTYLILTVTSILFWMIYYTGPMGITLFIKNNVDKHLFNYEIATQWINNINSFVIILGAPLVAWVVSTLQNKGYQLPESKQFVFAFLFLAVSFLLLSMGIKFSDIAGRTALYWVFLHIFTQGFAELLIGPVGYAMIGRIAPTHLQGLLMGTWMMVSGVSVALSHYFSNEMVKTNATDPLITNADYAHVFNQLGGWAILGALFLYFISYKISKHMAENKESVEALSH